MKFHFSVINLWCSKNLVDLEFTIWQILSFSGASTKNDIKFFEDPLSKKVEYLIINTCWFLSSSREEAEETIKYYDELWKKIILMWCYIPVRDDDFLKTLKNLYKIIPVEKSESTVDEIFWDTEKIKSKIQDFKEWKLDNYLKNLERLNSDKKAFVWSWTNPRFPFNSPYSYEFVKIAEWCDNRCSFCIIPKIRWNQTSRPIEDIIDEIKNLVNLWVKEIEIISQDTTRYWSDLYWDVKLFELLEEIEKIDLDFRFRLFYLYPDVLTLKHLEKLKNFKKFIPYFDLPVQHINPKILKRMWRFYDDKHIFALFDFIKSEFKDAFLHTNFIVWFPWEQELEFQDLIDFAKKYEFDSVSMFGYHDEKLAWSSKLDQKVDDKEIVYRVEQMSAILNKIYDKKEQNRIWKEFIGYVYDFDDKNVHIRWEYKAPELDELDIVPFKDIIEWKVDIWEKVRYIK